MAPNAQHAADPTRSNRGRNARRRGAAAEVAVVNYLRANGYPDARRYLAGDGRQPGDLDWHPLVMVEVKDVASSAWPTWQRQALDERPPGTAVVVVRRTRGCPDVGLWPARLYTSDKAGLALLGMLHDAEDQGMWVTGEREWWSVPFRSILHAVHRLDGR